MNESIAARPFIGFIVEGDGEYHSYPSLVNRICQNAQCYCPRVNAGGYGGIIKNLSEHLDDLVQLYHPYEVIVTIDLIDVIKDHMFDNCELLKKYLLSEITRWYANSQNDTRLQPLPNRIESVIQIPKFESWLVSDIKSLKSCGVVDHHADEIENVEGCDVNIIDWVKTNMPSCFNSKSPRQVKEIVSKLEPHTMIAHSRSFQKFEKEIKTSYKNWMEMICEE